MSRIISMKHNFFQTLCSWIKQNILKLFNIYILIKMIIIINITKRIITHQAQSKVIKEKITASSRFAMSIRTVDSHFIFRFIKNSKKNNKYYVIFDAIFVICNAIFNIYLLGAPRLLATSWQLSPNNNSLVIFFFRGSSILGESEAS